jgi:DNA-binding transcriptional LysR family regulator
MQTPAHKAQSFQHRASKLMICEAHTDDPAPNQQHKFDCGCVPKGGDGRSVGRRARLAELEPNIRLDSRVPHTLLAMAEAGHGVATIPSQRQAHRYDLKVVRTTYRGKPVRELLASCGTSGVRCRASRRLTAICSPSICATS